MELLPPPLPPSASGSAAKVRNTTSLDQSRGSGLGAARLHRLIINLERRTRRGRSDESCSSERQSEQQVSAAIRPSDSPEMELITQARWALTAPSWSWSCRPDVTGSEGSAPEPHTETKPRLLNSAGQNWIYDKSLEFITSSFRDMPQIWICSRLTTF